MKNLKDIIFCVDSINDVIFQHIVLFRWFARDKGPDSVCDLLLILI